LFARVLKFVFSLEYNREAMEIARIVIRDEFVTPKDYDEYIAASFDNVTFHIV